MTAGVRKFCEAFDVMPLVFAIVLTLAWIASIFDRIAIDHHLSDGTTVGSVSVNRGRLVLHYQSNHPISTRHGAHFDPVSVQSLSDVFGEFYFDVTSDKATNKQFAHVEFPVSAMVVVLLFSDSFIRQRYRISLRHSLFFLAATSCLLAWYLRIQPPGKSW